MRRVVFLGLVCLLPLLAGASRVAWGDAPPRIRPAAVRATDLEGEGLASALLFAVVDEVDARPLFHLQATPIGRADASGWIDVPTDLEEGAFLVLWATDHAAQVVPEETGRVEVALPRAEHLEGRVRFGGLAEAAGLEIFALPTGRRRRLAQKTMTGGDGTYRLEALEAGLWRLFLRRPDGRLQPLGITRAGQSVGDVEVEAGVSAVGRLIDEDADGSNAVPGVAIRMEPLEVEGRGRSREGTSNDEGRFVVLGLLPGIYRAVSADPLWDFVPRPPRVDVQRTHATPVGPWFMQRRQALEGRVTNLEGRGVEGAEVRVFREMPGRPDLAEDALRVEPARTDAEGAFRFARLRPGEGYRLVVASPEHASHVTEPFRVRAGARTGDAVVTRLPDLRIDRGLDLDVRVVDGAGNRVSGASILLAPARIPDASGHPAWETFRRQGSTDADGRASFQTMLQEGWVCRVSKAGWLDTRIEIPEPTTGHFGEQEVTLLRGATVRGVVATASGKPAEGFLVRAVDHRGRDVARGVTDALGGFVFEGLRPVATDFEVRAPGDVDEVVLARAPGVLPGASPLLALTVPVLHGIAGLLLGIDPEGPGVRVLVDAPRHDAVLDRFRYETVRVLSLEPDPAGSATFVVANLPPGAYALRAVQGGRDTAPLSVRIEDEDVFDVRLPLPYAAKVAGTTVDGEGDPVVGVRVQLERVRADGDRPYRPIGDLVTSSDESGSFSLPEVSPGVWNLVADHPAYAPHLETLRVQEGDVLVLEDITMGLGGAIEGVVMSRLAAAVEGAEVQLRLLGDPEVGMRTRTGAGGAFRFARLRAGTYVVALRSPLTGVGRPEVLVEVEDGATSRIEFGTGGRAQIEGTVMLGADRLAGAVLELVGHGSASGALLRLQTVTDAAGVFSWTALPAGAYTVRLLHGTAALETDVALRALDRVQLDLEASTARLRGTARFAAGGGLVGATVEAFALDVDGAPFEDPIAKTRTDGQGAFELTGLPVGRYLLQVDAPGLAPGPQMYAQSDLPGSDYPVEMVLGLGGTLDIAVGGAKGELIAGSRVWLEDLSGRALHRTPYVVGPEGRIRIEGVPAGRFAVRVEAPGFGTPPRVVVDLREGVRVPIQAKLLPASRMRLVVAGLGPDPVTRARIDVTRLDTGEVVARRRPLRRLVLNPRWGYVPRTGVIAIDDLQPGRYAIDVDGGASYGVARVEVDVPAGQSVLVPIVLRTR